MGRDSLARTPLPGSRETWEEVPTLSNQVHPYSTFLTDKGRAPARSANDGGRGALPRDRACAFQTVFAAFPHLFRRVGRVWFVSTFFRRATPVARERAPTSCLRGSRARPYAYKFKRHRSRQYFRKL